LAGWPVFMAVFLRKRGRIDMATDETGKAPEGGEDPRLTSLEDRLQAAHRAEAERTAPKGTGGAFTGKGASQGNRVLSTLIGAPLGAMLIGWLIDRWLNSAPAAMLTMLFLGIVSAFVQIWRISQERAE
jgi:ATP synthase protein I